MAVQQFYRLKAARHLLGDMPKSTCYQQRACGKIPPPDVWLGEKMPAYSEALLSEIQARLLADSAERDA
jgi:hypothetical protein